MLEDDSGRIELVGPLIKRHTGGEGTENNWGNQLVTGVIMAALGCETDSGAFEVHDICFAGPAPTLHKIPSDTKTMDIDGSQLHLLPSPASF